MSGGWSYIIGGYVVSFTLIVAYEIFLLTRRAPHHITEAGADEHYKRNRDTVLKTPPEKGGGG